ncbi:hypothetical protein L7F22_045803 [Adiantum nelumboides]|nr:hypothetical protein [Adiantum nelumboides]
MATWNCNGSMRLDVGAFEDSFRDRDIVLFSQTHQVAGAWTAYAACGDGRHPTRQLRDLSMGVEGYGPIWLMVVVFFTFPTLTHCHPSSHFILLPRTISSSAARAVFFIPRGVGYMIVYGGVVFSCIILAIAICWCLAHKLKYKIKSDDLFKDAAPSCASARERKISKYQAIIDRIEGPAWMTTETFSESEGEIVC